MSHILMSVATPVLTALPGAHARWEESGSIEDVARIAEVADRLNYHHLTCSEHIGVPADEAARRGARYWDPLATSDIWQLEPSESGSPPMSSCSAR